MLTLTNLAAAQPGAKFIGSKAFGALLAREFFVPPERVPKLCSDETMPFHQGSLGHFSVPTLAVGVESDAAPKLVSPNYFVQLVGEAVSGDPAVGWTARKNAANGVIPRLMGVVAATSRALMRIGTGDVDLLAALVPLAARYGDDNVAT
jgi:hypothetical protein